MKQTNIILLIVCSALLCATCSSAGRNRIDLPVSQSISEIPGLQRVGEIPAGDRPKNLYCVNSLHCWLQQGGRLLRTADAGRNWTSVSTAAQEELLRDFSFYGPEGGWAVTSSDLFRSEDGGVTWTKTANPFNSAGEIKSIHVSDGSQIWLAGGLYRKQTRDELKFGVPSNARLGDQVIEEAIFRSDDGGRNWQQEPLSPASMGRILKLQYVNRNVGIALGNGVFYYMRSGGVWSLPKFPRGCVRKEYLDDTYEGQPVSVALLDSDWWWLAYSDGRVIKSEDGGRSWCDLVQPGSVQFEASAPQFFESLHFVNRSTGWGLGKDKYLYRSEDGGKSWIRVSSDVRFDTASFGGDRFGMLASTTGLFRINTAEFANPKP